MEEPELSPWRRSRTRGRHTCVPNVNRNSEWLTKGMNVALQGHKGGLREPSWDERRREQHVHSLEKPELGEDGEEGVGRMRQEM